MNKKILQFCLMFFCGTLLHAYDDSIDFEDLKEDNIENLIEEVTTIYQDLETFYNNNELNEKNLSLLLQKHDIYNIDELIYLLNNDKNILIQETNTLQRGMKIKSFLLGCVGTYLGYIALSSFWNKDKYVEDTIDSTLKDNFILKQINNSIPLHEIETEPFKDFKFTTFINIYKIFDEKIVGENNTTIFNKDTDYATLKRKYIKLANIYHPDKNVGNSKQEEFADKFKTITNAHDILKDPEKRELYNQFLKQYYSLLPTITKEVHKTIAGFSIFSIGVFSIIPLIVRANNKLITKNNDFLKNLNTIIQHIEYIQGEELA